MARRSSSVVSAEDKPLKHLDRIVKNLVLDIEFQNLKYSVRNDNSKGGKRSGVEGSIKVNNLPRDLENFNKISSYITEDNVVQPLLTVKEAMTFAAGFKLGTYVKYEEKIAVVRDSNVSENKNSKAIRPNTIIIKGQTQNETEETLYFALLLIRF
ncbi:hypothetical protein BDFB_013827 [Asbolus verrucosus]|uniref:Uncharacterized protein n=1 Tax=Asbolus verrucosus TaxID=1661398 RepID=A0A482V6P9_ASBVE|nr:hypothetical protein BDFB_013827 [Asbolus verrucosus]